jgi:hypothetical protein
MQQLCDKPVTVLIPGIAGTSVASQQSFSTSGYGEHCSLAMTMLNLGRCLKSGSAKKVGSLSNRVQPRHSPSGN